MPHPEIFNALEVGTNLLVDDGRVRLRVESFGRDFAETRVIAGGAVSDRKGVNVPGVVLPLSALANKDRADLDYGLMLGIDWVALSFVQRPRHGAAITRTDAPATPAAAPANQRTAPSRSSGCRRPAQSALQGSGRRASARSDGRTWPPQTQQLAPRCR